MIEVFVPFVLILLNWDAGQPERSIEVNQRVFIDEKTCLAAAHDIERRREPEHGRAFAWRCVPQPQGIEIYHPGQRD